MSRFLSAPAFALVLSMSCSPEPENECEVASDCPAGSQCAAPLDCGMAYPGLHVSCVNQCVPCGTATRGAYPVSDCQFADAGIGVDGGGSGDGGNVTDPATDPQR